MKSLMTKIFTALVLLGFVGCNETDYDVEQYKKVVYVLSYDYHVYEYTHHLGQPESVGYVTVYCGGTKGVDQDVTVVFEEDTVLFDNYNEINHDLDTSKYAQILDPKFYDIDSYSVQFKSGQLDPYVLLPIRVRPVGLSPDSVYFIPLAVKSISGYELNKERTNVLYQVVMKNDYAKAFGNTTYTSRGNRTPEGKNPIKIASTKRVYPLDASVVRVGAGAESVNYANASSIAQKCLKVTINGDNSLRIEPISEKMQVQQLGGAADNHFFIERKIMKFNLHYRYRVIETEATESSQAVWGAWTEVEELLKRVDSDN